MYIYLIRHGQTEYNIGEPRFRGQKDIALSDYGIRQAEVIADTLQSILVDVVYYSPLNRTKTTAEKIYKYHPNAQFIKEPLLITLNFGLWQGKYHKDVFKTETEKKLWFTNPNAFLIPNGETFYDILSRIHQLFFRLHNQKEKNIILVTHGVVIAVILLYMFKLDPSHFWSFQADPASITLLRFDKNKKNTFNILKFNETEHLNALK